MILDEDLELFFEYNYKTLEIETIENWKKLSDEQRDFLKEYYHWIHTDTGLAKGLFYIEQSKKLEVDIEMIPKVIADKITRIRK